VIIILRASLQLPGVATINRAMGAIGAVGVVATAESSCKGGLIGGCSARVSAAQSGAHELGSASHHRLRFTRVVRVCAWGRGKPCSRYNSWPVRASHRRSLLSRDPLAMRAQSALNATQVTVPLWPAGAVRAIIMGLVLLKGKRGGAGK
jgi:hypothetical protein